MGWWSPTIMGGDTPLDELSGILKKAGLKEHSDRDDWRWEDHPVQVSKALKRITEQEWIDLRRETYEPDQDIFLQVLALVHLGSGTSLPPQLKDMTLKALTEEDVSTWNDPASRRAHLDAFADLITHAKPGHPVLPPSQGLFQVIAETISSPVPPSPSPKSTRSRSKKKP